MKTNEIIENDDKERFINWLIGQYPEFIKLEYFRWKGLHSDTN